jgi:hypothetical protein
LRKKFSNVVTEHSDFVKTCLRMVGKIFKWFQGSGRSVVRAGFAARVVFYYPGEDGTYLDGAWVRIYDSGIVDVNHPREQVTTHIQNVEVIWKDNRQSRSDRPFVLHSFEKRSGSSHTEPLSSKMQEDLPLE